jgi:hypothetical protein
MLRVMLLQIHSQGNWMDWTFGKPTKLTKETASKPWCKVFTSKRKIKFIILFFKQPLKIHLKTFHYKQLTQKNAGCNFLARYFIYFNER